MSTIYEWVRNIVIFMIFNTLIMNIFGDSNYKKYIRLVTGMILVVLVVSPIIKFLRLSDRVEDLFNTQVYAVDVSDFKSQLSMLEQNRHDAIWADYKTRILEQAEGIVNRYDYTTVSGEIEFDTNEESSSYGEIKNMSLVLEEKDEKKKGSKEKIRIDKIVIAERKDEVVAMAPSPVEINIKKELSDFYNMEGDNINISIQGGSYEKRSKFPEG